MANYSALLAFPWFGLFFRSSRSQAIGDQRAMPGKKRPDHGNTGKTHFSLFLAVLSASSAGFLFGVNTGNIAGALPFIQEQFHCSLFQQELIVSSTILFAFLSAFLSAPICQKVGHRIVLLGTGLFFFIGAYLAGTATSSAELLVARSLLGIAIGVSSYAAPLYLGEIVPPQHRGFFVLLNGLAITGGEAAAFYIDTIYSPLHQWRPMLFWSLFPAAFFLITMWCLPRFNLQATMHPLHNKMKTLFLTKEYRRFLIIGIGLGVFQQFFGINTIMYYGPYIFAKANFILKGNAIDITLLMGVVNMITTFITGCLVDKIGRRILLLSGASIACLSLMSISFLFQTDGLSSAYSNAIVTLMIIYIVGYCMSVGSLFWLIISEIFPLIIRDQAASIATSIQWLSNFIVSISFLSLLEYWGPSTTFFIYASICFTAVIFIYKWIPETNRLVLGYEHSSLKGSL